MGLLPVPRRATPSLVQLSPDLPGLLGVLKQLIAFPTESRTSNTELIDYYADLATGLGGVAHVVPGEVGADSRSNLHVRFGPEAEGGIFLSGHTDVVPAGKGWTSDPYSVRADDDRLYGRGTADMKGFLAAALTTMAGIDLTKLERPVHFGLSYDEEIGCVGVHHLLEHLRTVESCQPDVLIVGEPTEMQLCTAHSGKQVFGVAITSPSGHSSRSPEQPTAIEAGAAVVAAISEINTSAAGSPGGYSANVGTFHGGVAVNVLSPTCELDFECRHSAIHSPDTLLEPVFAVIEQWKERLQAIGGDVVTTPTANYPALATSPDEPSVGRLQAALDDAPFGEVSFGCEAGLYTETLPAPAVIFGPGNIADAHRPDEYVLASDLATTLDRLTSTIHQFCIPTTES